MPMLRRAGPRALKFVVSLVACAAAGTGCEGCSGGRSASRGGQATGADAGSGLSAEQARQVLARVGNRTITLGDYALALERMDPFERMRYQTEDRRQALLDEMINVELMAREAERRGLDKKPETQELVRQFQRNELLRRLHASVPGSRDLPSAEVQSYYLEHRAEFRDPERRRAAQIVLDDEKLAARVIAQAASADADRWRALVLEHNPGEAGPAGDKTRARPPLEVAGDLGTFAADDPEPVPEPVRRAAFEISEVGGVYPRPVAHAGRFHVVRLVTLVEARQRSLEEVDELVRARLVRARQERAEAELVARLRQTIPVSIDEAALGAVPPPPSLPPAPAAAP